MSSRTRQLFLLTGVGFSLWLALSSSLRDRAFERAPASSSDVRTPHQEYKILTPDLEPSISYSDRPSDDSAARYRLAAPDAAAKPSEPERMPSNSSDSDSDSQVNRRENEIQAEAEAAARLSANLQREIESAVAAQTFFEMAGEIIRESQSTLIGGARSRPADRSLPKATVGEEYCQTLGDREQDGFNDVRLAAGIVPKGLVLNRASSGLCGTPLEAGIFRFAIEFRFALEPGFRRTFRLVVAEAEEEETEGELRLVTAQLEVGQVGAEYVFQLEAEGGEPPYRWSIEGLPDDLEFDAGTGIVAGTPQAEGEFLLEVLVADGAGASASLPYTLLVRQTPVFITTSSIERGTIGEALQIRFVAQGGILPYRWEILSGNLPQGLEFDSINGVISGIPEITFEGVLQVRVLDAEESADTADFQFNVGATNLSIVTGALADGFENRQFAFTLTAQGGAPPYRWTTAGGSLPDGLALASGGLISGSPQYSGEFFLLFVVEDSQRQQATRRLRLRVQETEEPDDGSDDGDTGEEPEPTVTPGGPANPGPTAFPTPQAVPGVTKLEAIPSDAKVGLTWKNPGHEDFIQTAVVRKIGAPPENAADGVLITEGINSTFLDADVQNGVTYFYAAFAEYPAALNAEIADSEPAEATPNAVRLDVKPDPFADQVAGFSPLDANCFNCAAMPSVVLGPPFGGGLSQGSPHVVSIGAKVNGDLGRTAPYGGSITLQFTDNIVVDGPGPDFTIFENAFRLSGTDFYFVEPAVVEVSADGELFYRFPFDFVPHYNTDGTLNLFNPFCYAAGFAGVKEVYSNASLPGSPAATDRVLSGGDQFDLSSLPGAPLSWIRFVRITSTGDGWIRDEQADVVRHSNDAPTFGASGVGNSGFDLDSITALNY